MDTTRFRSTLIDSERYLLTCSRYIDLNPLRANMVKHPRDCPWSSYCVYAEGSASSVITAHALYLQLGANPEARRGAYRALFAHLIDDAELAALRVATKTSTVLGDDHFRRGIEVSLQRKTTRLAVGGDRKSAAFKARRSAFAT